MPTYQYECDACGHELEALQSMTEPKLKKCPKCGKNKLTRLIGAGAGVIFKGTGFYQTDYKPSGAPKTESATKPAETTKAADKPKGESCGGGCACHGPSAS